MNRIVPIALATIAAVAVTRAIDRWFDARSARPGLREHLETWEGEGGALIPVMADRPSSSPRS
jgi:hypothetical protein